MVFSAKSNRFLKLVLAGVFLGCVVFLVPVNAAPFARIHAAINELTQAQGAEFAGDQQLKLLDSALHHLQAAFPKDSQKAQAIALVTSAIADAKAKDSAKFNTDLTQALAVANAIVSGSPANAAAQAQPAQAAPTVRLSEDQARAVVLIKGDNGEGTGFLIKTVDGPVVVTNIHVISNNPNLKITTNTGAQVTILSYKGATDRDLAMIAVKDDPSFSYLTLAADLSHTVQVGDEVITPGNSEGGEVMLNTDGKVLGIGPDRIEFSNPIYHGNSGGPIFDVKTGTVIGVVTEAMKVVNSDDLDKASFASRNSAISGSMRYFGFRLDNVPAWEAYDWNRFQNETAFLDKFDLRSRCLDSYINTPAAEQPAATGKKKKKKKENDGSAPPASSNDSPDAEIWQQDEKIVKANNDFIQRTAGGADTSQQVDAVRELYGDIRDIAGLDMDAIQNTNNFYSFDQLRAKDEIAYRKALQVELEGIGNNVSRLGSMPRTNN